MKSLFNTNYIPLQRIGSICTYDAPAMLESQSGFVILMRNEIPEVMITHCILHRQVLVSKALPGLKNVIIRVLMC